MVRDINYSIIVLTYNRIDRAKFHIENFKKNPMDDVELIVVDNCSDEPIDGFVKNNDRIVLVRNIENLGAVGRNRGIEVARGSIIITLDDDVYGIDDNDLMKIRSIFDCRPEVAAINFKILEEATNKITDWCHPCDSLHYSNVEFETNDITEEKRSLDGHSCRLVQGK